MLLCKMDACGECPDQINKKLPISWKELKINKIPPIQEKNHNMTSLTLNAWKLKRDLLYY